MTPVLLNPMNKTVTFILLLQYFAILITLQLYSQNNIQKMKNIVQDPWRFLVSILNPISASKARTKNTSKGVIEFLL